MKNKPLVSIIIPTRNRAEILENNLAHIFKQVYKAYEIIIIDDDSTDDTAEIVSKFNSPVLKYYKNLHRKGQTYNKNYGVTKSNGIIVVFLDDDCIVSKDWLNKLIQPLLLDNNLVACGGYIKNLAPIWDRYDMFFKVIDYSDLNFLFSSKTGRIVSNGNTSAHFNLSAKLIKVDWISAGNMAVRKDTFLSVGGFNDIFEGDCSYEEPDLCYRLLKRGKICYNSEAKVLHLYANKNSRDYTSKLYYKHKNHIKFIRQNKIYLNFYCGFITGATIIYYLIISFILGIFDKSQFLRIKGIVDAFKNV